MSFGKEIFEDIETFSKLECKLYGVFGLNNNIIRYIDYNQSQIKKLEIDNDGYKNQIKELEYEIEVKNEEIKIIKEQQKECKERIEELKNEVKKKSVKTCSNCGKIGHNKATCPSIKI
tara:strand:+ start:687 stop:1040 length:354 start_codon:yes stop_codon:yes gene_type:complete